MNFNRIINTSTELESQSGFSDQLNSHCMAIETISIQAYLDAETNDNTVNSFDKDKDQAVQDKYFIYTTDDSRD